MTANDWRVAVDAPLKGALTYSAPAELRDQMRPGLRVLVPLSKRKVSGLVLGPSTEPRGEFAIKDILSIESQYEALTPAMIEWIEWMSRYYLHPVGRVAALVYPSLEKTEKVRKSSRPSVVPLLDRSENLVLNPEQKKVVDDISQASGFGVHLIFGVTGSGKTEIYLRLLEKTLAEGKAGLFLLPEIALTPQIIQRVSSRFPDQAAVLHSQLTDRERTNQWWEIVSGRKKILVGARSALFCPIPNLGLIIVDEEHEPSYKQEEKLKYHGRDSAIMLARSMNCPLLLGSATPSLESWSHAKSGKYQLHKLLKRVSDRSLPEIQVIDLRLEERKNPDLPTWMSDPLHEILVKTHLEGKQSALFLNRRGLAPLVLCESCGYVHECPNCEISLTLHQHSHLVCHYCDYHENFKESCPSCKEGEMKPVGLGTEQIEKDLQRLFPNARVKRADRDEIQNRLDLEEMIQQMESREIDFLVGTQMIAKGLDFAGLQTVGLVLADIGFNIPDFRSTERSFQLITQMSGRAGRHTLAGEDAGRVIIQTYNTEHPSLVKACAHDFEGFAEEELRTRKELHYPPFGRIASIRIKSPSLVTVRETAGLTFQRAEALRTRQDSYSTAIEILGPAEAPLAKLRNEFRYQMLIKALDPGTLNRFCFQLLGDESWVPRKAKVSIDVDPLQLL